MILDVVFNLVVSNYKQILYYLKVFGRLHDVTTSIKLVAFTKFKKIQYRIKMSNESLCSFVKLASIADSLVKYLKVYLIVPITSDKGCCGSINTHLLSSLENYIHSVNSFIKKIFIILIGKKGKIFVKRNFKSQYVRNVTNVFDTVLSFLSVLKISEEIQNVVFDKCIFLFNHFNTINEQKVYFFDLLSYTNFVKNICISKDIISLDCIFWTILYIAYSKYIYILSDLYNFFISIILLNSLLDHEISELGGRITSMEKSSQNALEMYNSLQIQYNKARQSYITNQLIEICSASAAINIAVK